VGQLPEEEGRLLIMHGTMDENVHFMQHTAQLVNLLIKHGKPYQLQVHACQPYSPTIVNVGPHWFNADPDTDPGPVLNPGIWWPKNGEKKIYNWKNMDIFEKNAI
jgi:hypothetical protein